jgi:hypothetical protein
MQFEIGKPRNMTASGRMKNDEMILAKPSNRFEQISRQMFEESKSEKRKKVKLKVWLRIS